jgi:hypothetical protein
LALSIAYQSFVRNLFIREAKADILAIEILEDGSVLALKDG